MSATKQHHAPALLVIIAFATVYIVWGSTYFFIQKAVHNLPPFLLGAMRFLTAGGLLLGWCAFRKENIFDKESVKTAFVTGFLLLFIGNGAVIWVEQFMPSAMVAIIVSSAPVWFVLLDKPKWKENFRNTSTLAGLAAGFIGVILLFWDEINNSMQTEGVEQKLTGLLLLVIASVAWSGGSLYSKYNSSAASSSVKTSWQMIAGGLAFLPCSIVSGEMRTFSWQAVAAEGWWALIYLILMGSIAAYSAYVWLLQVRPAAQVSTYAYVNPVIAVLLGVFFANEKVSGIQILGLFVILGSVLLINLAKYRQRASSNLHH